MKCRTKTSPTGLQQPERRGCTDASIHTAVNNNTPQQTADSVASSRSHVSPCVCGETERGVGQKVHVKQRERERARPVHTLARCSACVPVRRVEFQTEAAATVQPV